jgi:hypothetical protein
MKWFIVVLMMGGFANGDRNTYIYFKPELDSLEHCEAYVAEHTTKIQAQMLLEFNGDSIDTIYCFREDKLKNFLEVNSKAGKTEI